MMYNLGRKIVTSTRSIFTSAIRRGGHDEHDHGGVPGANLPFDIGNRHKLALYMGLWFGSGFAIPFLTLRFQLKKKSGLL